MRQIKILLLALCFFFSSCGYTHLKIGTLVYDPPFVLSLDAGYDIDLSRLLCQRLNEDCEFKPMSHNELHKAILKGEIDLAIGGILISPNNGNEFIYSIPYMLSRGEFLVLNNNKFKSLKNLRKKTIGVIQDDLNGSLYYKYLLDHYPGQFNIIMYGNIQDILAALKNNTISAAFLFRSVVGYWARNSDNQFKSLGPITQIGTGLALIALPRNNKLMQRIDKILLEMDKDNTFVNLYNTYIVND